MEEEFGGSVSPMLSFPSTFNTGGDGLLLLGASPDHAGAFNNEISHNENVAKFKSEIERIKTKNLAIRDVRQHYYSESAMNISQYKGIYPTIKLGDPNQKRNKKTYFEDPYHFPSALLREMNLYRFMYKNSTTQLFGAEREKDGEGNVKKDGGTTYYSIQTAVAPSLFNPKFNVQVIGMTQNVPLLNDHRNRGPYAVDDDISDCSVRKLVELSNKELLGQQKYRLVDFLFCKDYGRVSNNHMITLRKFTLPVGDIIGAAASPHISSKTKGGAIKVDNTDDIGRLVAWFDTEDNKLEDIIKYSYKYTWKQLNSEIQREESQESDAERGHIGMLANMTPEFSKAVNNGTAAGGSTWLGMLAGSKTASFNQKSNSAMAKARFVDKNKVYEPKQTIQDTHIPEGKLVFTNEFTLTFSYKLRAYENINPKSAFLDLLANIHEVTYCRGKFWGGARQVVGPGPNTAQYEKAYRFIDNAVDKLGGGLSGLLNGSTTFPEFLGVLGSIIPQSILNGVAGLKEMLSTKGVGGAVKELAQKAGEKLQQQGLGDVIKGQLKNALGRPSFYAFHSLLTDNIVGLWHVTIGNPRNPIVSMGNLIMTNAEVQHKGPLGLDDFPTELKVICSLKPAMSRDLTGIQKMYTQGVSGIYLSKQYDKISTQLLFDSSGMDIVTQLDNFNPSSYDTENEDKDIAKKAQDDLEKARNAIDEKAAAEQVNVLSGLAVDGDSSKWGMITSNTGAMINQMGTSNLFKSQVANDQEAGPTL